MNGLESEAIEMNISETSRFRGTEKDTNRKESNLKKLKGNESKRIHSKRPETIPAQTPNMVLFFAIDVIAFAVEATIQTRAGSGSRAQAKSKAEAEANANAKAKVEAEAEAKAKAEAEAEARTQAEATSGRRIKRNPKQKQKQKQNRNRKQKQQ